VAFWNTAFSAARAWPTTASGLPRVPITVTLAESRASPTSGVTGLPSSDSCTSGTVSLITPFLGKVESVRLMPLPREFMVV